MQEVDGAMAAKLKFKRTLQDFRIRETGMGTYPGAQSLATVANKLTNTSAS
jgi:hypothetical protein